MTKNSYPIRKIKDLGLRCVYCYKPDLYGLTRTHAFRENSDDMVLCCRTCLKKREKRGDSHAETLLRRVKYYRNALAIAERLADSEAKRDEDLSAKLREYRLDLEHDAYVKRDHAKQAEQHEKARIAAGYGLTVQEYEALSQQERDELDWDKMIEKVSASQRQE